MKEPSNTHEDNQRTHDLILSHGITLLTPSGQRAKPITFRRITPQEIKDLKIPVYKQVIP